MSHWLGHLESYALSTAAVPLHRLNEIAHKRHLLYDSRHPWNMILQYIDPVKLRVYYDAYPGLDDLLPGRGKETSECYMTNEEICRCST
jgi:hypothetical protein